MPASLSDHMVLTEPPPGLRVQPGDPSSTGHAVTDHAGPGRVGHEGRDSGRSDKDQGPAWAAEPAGAISGYDGPPWSPIPSRSGAHAGHTLTAIVRRSLTRLWFHGQPSQCFHCADSDCLTERGRSLRLDMKTGRLHRILTCRVASDVCRQ